MLSCIAATTALGSAFTAFQASAVAVLHMPSMPCCFGSFKDGSRSADSILLIHSLVAGSGFAYLDGAMQAASLSMCSMKMPGACMILMACGARPTTALKFLLVTKH